MCLEMGVLFILQKPGFKSLCWCEMKLSLDLLGAFLSWVRWVRRCSVAGSSGQCVLNFIFVPKAQARSFEGAGSRIHRCTGLRLTSLRSLPFVSIFQECSFRPRFIRRGHETLQPDLESDST
ncbi:hypothetical protein CEXT_796391 [Caerostris extrusa]|uniref:Uncharacterized protein n=1 Tax=Caerostris extrusa TaxID=172846 RepID=A0AAV4VGU0_CAEEX|nr:hypothetical protein CEXT_796391 [Caerostris extrusa]